LARLNHSDNAIFVGERITDHREVPGLKYVERQLSVRQQKNAS